MSPVDDTGATGETPPEGSEETAEPAALTPEARAEMLTTLRARMATLAEAQGERPLILPAVDRLAVGAIVQDWTGIPMGRMLASQTERALQLAGTLSERVVGQDHAMGMIANRIQTSYAGLGAPEKPIGVFMLCGPSGVGKTETALALAETLYGGEQNLISINMSEFQEAHTVSYPERRAARLCRLWQGRDPDRGGAAPTLFGDPAGRGGKGPPGRA